MVFSSLSFLCVFFPIVFALNLVLPSVRLKNALLLVASLLFYSFGEPVYVLLMVASSLVNFGAGVLLGTSARRKLVVGVAVVFNVGLLVAFKYADMIVGSLNALLGTSLPLPQVALPIGISFFTFQAMSYVIDVYRGEVEPQKSFFDVLLYISFFPQLIAGPIVKYHDIAREIRTRHASATDMACGLRRFCVGLAKKVLIANNMAVAVDYLYSVAPGDLNALAAWTAVVAYMMQIYFDFSGYSDMAIGLGRMFGFHYKENFNYPYVATTLQDFWRRWHISLSTWFKEYLYIPLGGNRKGTARTMLNKLAVFFLCGLWHGASWTFVVWGLVHGAFLMLESVVPVKRMPRALGHLYCLLVVCLAFVLFRADSIGQAGAIIVQMFAGWDFSDASMVIAMRQLSPVFLAALAASLVAALPVRDAAARALDRCGERARLCGIALSYVASIALLALCFLSLASGAYNPFIYFRF
ncbi:MBOAT family O-acyltransferase [Xiamenia xianingshaonis]|uniref:MBOAT family protein n=1 Tax=Xiamenia xianingshaonis TaxID=2682776 RepID=A0A9E6MSA7_9ACTN|nr:MBOAT family O-acyltransferase [Xiamenia xianingshaonis]NHM14314.1 MBOAT family protein [Xiamenia xianingshaonis]QTU84796.1 MBOAT family protein [Xiamenia xianingshaonis]